jgi:hypothetical protein
MKSSSCEFASELCLGQAPVAEDGFGRYLQHFSRLLCGQAAKESQLHHLALSWVHSGQRFQGSVHGENVWRCLDGDGKSFIQLQMDGIAAALPIVPGTRKIDQDTSHQTSAEREEVSPIPPANAFDTGKPDVDLVNKRSGLQQVSLLLSRQTLRRKPAKFLIHQGNELI